MSTIHRLQNDLNSDDSEADEGRFLSVETLQKSTRLPDNTPEIRELQSELAKTKSEKDALNNQVKNLEH